MNTTEDESEPVGENPCLSGVERLLQGADLVAAKVLLAEQQAGVLDKLRVVHHCASGADFCDAGCYGAWPCATRRILDGVK